MRSIVLNQVQAISDETAGKGYWELKINYPEDGPSPEPVEARLGSLPDVLTVLNKYMKYESVDIKFVPFDDPEKK